MNNKNRRLESINHDSDIETHKRIINRYDSLTRRDQCLAACIMSILQKIEATEESVEAKYNNENATEQAPNTKRSAGIGFKKDNLIFVNFR